MSKAKQVVIIGAGINGLCSAYYLAQRGHGVTVIDRGAPDSENCSFGNAGYVTPSHFIPLAAPGMVMMGLKWMRDPESPFYVKPRLAPDLLSWAWQFHRAGTQAHVERSAPLLLDLNMAARALYEELDAALGHSFGFEKKGLMLLFKSQHALDEEAHVVEHATRLGLKAKLLSAQEAQAQNPNVRLEVCGAAFYAEDCHMAPGTLMAALQRECERLGVEFRWHTEVRTWQRQARRIAAVHTASGEVPGDEFVLCGGAWSTGTARQLGLKLPMQAGKGYSLMVPKPQQIPAMPMIFVERRVALTPLGGQLRIAGTMEISGLNTEVNPARVRGIKKSVPLYFPDFGDSDFAGVTPWVGLRPCSPDGLPYLGRTRKFDNLTIATGHAMMGLSLGPITGEIIAQTVSGEKPRISSALLDVDRFG